MRVVTKPPDERGRLADFLSCWYYRGQERS
jgi:hypothetical protein